MPIVSRFVVSYFVQSFYSFFNWYSLYVVYFFDFLELHVWLWIGKKICESKNSKFDSIYLFEFNFISPPFTLQENNHTNSVISWPAFRNRHKNAWQVPAYMK